MKPKENNLEVERDKNKFREVSIHELLTDCCFYYSAGSDITPIMECKNYISKYIYCDIAKFTNTHDNIYKLKRRLSENKFIEILKQNIDARWLGLEENTYSGGYNLKEQYKTSDLSVELSFWELNNVFFYLLYIVWDNTSTWINLFEKNNIKPKAICNYRYEGGVDFEHVELRDDMKPEIWMGHCHRQDYKLIKEIDYYGDYFDSKVDYYERKSI
jgi:hypothetical protein